ncbi:ABC transporter permease [Archaeoglobus neptunius]|uniref:ABC transporter permease n=1 Tax=Archaeoglobus neptunius TaxID=2798580 RepID=UPI001925ACD0|nr:ABC transporter permease [Archaeoglobus neptunius]
MKTYSSSLLKVLSETIAFAYRNYAVTKNEFYAIFEMLFWPVVSLISVGLLGEFLYLSKNEIAFIMIGVIALSVIQIIQIDVTYVMLLDMWSMSLKYIIVTPMPFYRMVIGAWLFGSMRGLVSLVLLVILSARLFGFTFSLPLLPAILFIAGMLLSAMLIGIFNCVLILVFGRRAEIFAWTLTAIVMLFCGIYYPVSILPEPFKTAGLLIPITHYLEYFRTFYGFPSTFPNPFLIGIAETVVYLAVLLIVAELSMKRARKTGLVLKLSE